MNDAEQKILERGVPVGVEESEETYDGIYEEA